MLTFVFRSACGAPHGIVQAAQCASGAGIHIADADYDGVRLVIQIQAVVDQLFEIDILREIEASTAGARASVTVTASFTTGSAFRPSFARAFTRATLSPL
jgi:hypothetical protein